METLTLARYILEMSLMEYDIIEERDSLVAAAALLLAIKMKGQPEWVINITILYVFFRHLMLKFDSLNRPKRLRFILAIKKRIFCH
jgi:hypothetical protein